MQESKAVVNDIQEVAGGCLDFASDDDTKVVKVARKRFLHECRTATDGLLTEACDLPRKYTRDSVADIGAWEFAGFDAARESQWYREPFADLLATLAEAYGVAPVIKWAW